jgi:hypothetical protein
VIARNDPFSVFNWVGGVVGVIGKEVRWDELLKFKCDIDCWLSTSLISPIGSSSLSNNGSAASCPMTATFVAPRTSCLVKILPAEVSHCRMDRPRNALPRA